jgi:hypothetical protein
LIVLHICTHVLVSASLVYGLRLARVPPVQNAAMDGLAEIFGNPNEPSVMGCGGASRVAGKGTHGISNVEVSGDVGVALAKWTKKLWKRKDWNC